MANEAEICLVIEKKLFGLATAAQWPRNPFLDCTGDNSLPKPCFR
jgi:hypothetical protein